MTRTEDSNRPAIQVEGYLWALAVERGLSHNTISAYRRDLEGYLAHLAGLGHDSSSPELVDGFLASLHERGMRPATIARKLAAVRGFHRFLVAEGEADEDPTRFTETPPTRMGFPKALDIDEAIRLVEAPPADTKLGIRDRAMLETLYGTAVRVSELVGLDLAELDLDTRTILVTGKGNKQRLVPMGRPATETIRSYLPVRLELCRSGKDPGAVFLNARGGRLTRQGIFGIDVTPEKRPALTGHRLDGAGQALKRVRLCGMVDHSGRATPVSSASRPRLRFAST